MRLANTGKEMRCLSKFVYTVLDIIVKQLCMRRVERISMQLR